MALPDINHQAAPAEVELERLSPGQLLAKALLLNPLANFLPSSITRALLKLGKSELAQANWADPGGWKSMVISYEAKPAMLSDRVLINGGTIPMALRNRRRLASRLIARLIDQAGHEGVHVLCLGAGPGTIIMEEEDPALRHVQRSTIPLERYGKPGDITGLVVYLATDAAYVTGQVFAVDGGRSIG